jgi:hypothetical protein
MKRGLIPSLHNRASTVSQERQNRFNVIASLSHGLQLSGYPQGSIDSVINSKGTSRPNKEEKPLGSVYEYIPYMKDISENFKRIGNRYNIRTIFKTIHS